MASSRVSFDQAAQSLLDAAIDPTRWNEAMEQISQYAGATGALLLQTNGSRLEVPHRRSMEEGLEIYFREGWHLRDERMRGVPYMRRYGIFVDQDFASRQEIETSDYYRGLLAPFGFNWSAGIGATNGDEEWSLVIQFDDAHGFVTPEEQKDFLRFGAHLKRAVLLANNLGFASATGMIDAYQSLGCPSFLLDRGGRVIRSNAAAEKLIGDGLSLALGVLGCGVADDNRELAGLVARLCRSPGIGETEALPSVIVRRPTKRPLIVEGIRINGMASAVFSPAKAILLVSDTERPSADSRMDLLRKIFGLTQTEALLVSHLAREVPLPLVAELLGISFETARSHLKRVFAKTSTNRQSELLLLLRRLRPLG
ncbi:MAG: helix-turn-helix transcriptional regulator [Rhizobiales bacterium]|nr:helix-turn-helix transcriptional regulator [Hyphomicrobiales bacterium]